MDEGRELDEQGVASQSPRANQWVHGPDRDAGEVLRLLAQARDDRRRSGHAEHFGQRRAQRRTRRQPRADRKVGFDGENAARVGPSQGHHRPDESGPGRRYGGNRPGVRRDIQRELDTASECLGRDQDGSVIGRMA